MSPSTEKASPPKQAITIRKRIDRLSLSSRRWLHKVAQQCNDPEADGYEVNREALKECSDAGVLRVLGRGRIELSGEVNALLYSQQYLAIWSVVVKPGTQFFCDQVHEVVRRHERLPDTWWCRGVSEDVGLFAFSEETVIRNRVAKQVTGSAAGAACVPRWARWR